MPNSHFNKCCRASSTALGAMTVECKNELNFLFCTKSSAFKIMSSGKKGMTGGREGGRGNRRNLISPPSYVNGRELSSDGMNLEIQFPNAPSNQRILQHQRFSRPHNNSTVSKIIVKPPTASREFYTLSGENFSCFYF